MTMENWSVEHRKVFDALKRILPEGEELNSLHRSITSRRTKHQSRCDLYESLEKDIQIELGSDMTSLLINYLVNPKDHHLDRCAESQDSIINGIAMIIAKTHCDLKPNQKSSEAILNRFLKIFKDPYGATEIAPNFNYREKTFWMRYYFPRADDCLEILLNHLEYDNVLNALSDIYQGKYNQIIDYGEGEYERHINTNEKLIGYKYNEFEKFLKFFFKTGRLTYDWFSKAHKLYPRYSRAHWASSISERLEVVSLKEAKEGTNTEFLNTYKHHHKRLVLELIDEIPESSEMLSTILSGVELSGTEWLRTGLDIVKKHSLNAKDLKRDHNGLGGCIRPLIDSYGLHNDETEKHLIEMLSKYSEKELLIILPYAGCARNAILKSLGWHSLLPFQKQIFALGGETPSTHSYVDDIYNCDNPMSGVIDYSEWLDTVENINEKHVTKYIKALQASSHSFTNLLVLVSAVRDKDKDKIEKKLVRHGQTAIKAYGLYPIKDKDELRDRYIKFKTMYSEATRYGAERQANTQAAVKAGIKNLAQIAGYADDIRLEWAMEADITNNTIPFDRDFEIEAWKVRLVLEGIKPRIIITKNEKQLKSVPTKVRKTEIYQQIKASQDTARKQATRFRKTLEDMMCSKEALSAEELSTLSRLPIVSAMLSQLIFKTQDNQFGFFSGNPSTLIGINEQKVSIKGIITIAHVYDLFVANVLSNWQEVVIKQRVVQPFKQAFRELYVVTPAEMETKTHSRRFVGHVIDGAIASRLLQSRNWSQVSCDAVEIYKRFPSHNLRAEIGFPDTRHFLAEDNATMDEIWFQGKEGKVDLDQIDALVFSEVMRDMDLLASVAHVGVNDTRWSTETAERRSDLVRNLMRDLSLSQVTCEGHYAYIKGKVAKYRVHLGSGVIHIQPGNYLCIVPTKKNDADLYLPFSEVDGKMAEIISKIFLLISDDQITDRKILDQIDRSIKLSA